MRRAKSGRHPSSAPLADAGRAPLTAGSGLTLVSPGEARLSVGRDHHPNLDGRDRSDRIALGLGTVGATLT